MPIQYPHSEAKIAAMFDRVAPRYDFLNRLLSARQDQRWRRQLIAMVPFRPNGRYLDVATGTGDVIIAAAQARQEYQEFVGVDISPEMLALARKKSARAQLDHLVFQVMSAEKLSLPSSCVDCVSIAFGLRNVVNRDKALAEFQRVLRPQGVLLILEFFIPAGGPLSRAFQFYFSRILPMIGGLFSDREAYTYLPQSVGSFYAPTKLRSALYDRGFTVESSTNFLFGACRLVKAVKH